MATDYIPIEINATSHKPGTYKGRTFKGDAELDKIAERVIALLRVEGLPIWQANEVLKKASSLIDWETMK